MEADGWDSERFIAWVQGQLRRKGWNSAEFARRLSVSSGTVSRWMNGERQPTPHSCDLIADVLGADVDLVLTLAGHRPEAEETDEDDPKDRIIAMIRRVSLTKDRLVLLEATLQAMLDIDRAERNVGSSNDANEV